MLTDMADVLRYFEYDYDNGDEWFDGPILESRYVALVDEPGVTCYLNDHPNAEYAAWRFEDPMYTYEAGTRAALGKEQRDDCNGNFVSVYDTDNTTEVLQGDEYMVEPWESQTTDSVYSIELCRELCCAVGWCAGYIFNIDELLPRCVLLQNADLEEPLNTTTTRIGGVTLINTGTVVTSKIGAMSAGFHHRFPIPDRVFMHQPMSLTRLGSVVQTRAPTQRPTRSPVVPGQPTTTPTLSPIVDNDPRPVNGVTGRFNSPPGEGGCLSMSGYTPPTITILRQWTSVRSTPPSLQEMADRCMIACVEFGLSCIGVTAHAGLDENGNMRCDMHVDVQVVPIDVPPFDDAVDIILSDAVWHGLVTESVAGNYFHGTTISITDGATDRSCHRRSDGSVHFTGISEPAIYETYNTTCVSTGQVSTLRFISRPGSGLNPCSNYCSKLPWCMGWEERTGVDGYCYVLPDWRTGVVKFKSYGGVLGSRVVDDFGVLDCGFVDGDCPTTPEHIIVTTNGMRGSCHLNEMYDPVSALSSTADDTPDLSVEQLLLIILGSTLVFVVAVCVPRDDKRLIVWVVTITLSLISYGVYIMDTTVVLGVVWIIASTVLIAPTAWLACTQQDTGYEWSVSVSQVICFGFFMASLVPMIVSGTDVNLIPLAVVSGLPLVILVAG